MGQKMPNRFMAAAKKGMEWVTSQMGPDGSLAPDRGVNTLEKTIWALSNLGMVVEANNILDWAKGRYMTEPGEWHGPNETDFDAWVTSYRNNFITIGALHLGRFDIASRAAFDHLMAYQHPSGAFFCSGPADRTSETTANALYSALGGWAALYGGRYDKAMITGDHMLEILRMQPDPEHRFYFVYDVETGQLVTEFPLGEAISYFVDASKPKQHFYQPGAIGGFLSELGLATGEEKYIQAAEKDCLGFMLRTMPESYEWPSKCKEGWGAAQIYRATGNEGAKEIAEKVGEITMLKYQRPDGSWDDFVHPSKDDLSSGDLVTSLELTAEFSFELTEMAKGLTLK